MTESNPQKIMITGNMGYVGPAVVRRLREQYPEAQLVGLDIGLFAHCLTNTSMLPEGKLDQQVFKDLRDVSLEDLHGYDAVVNLAAVSNDPMGKSFENATREINFEAGIRLAELAKEAGVSSFVFASSCSVYGAADGPDRKEEDQLNPLTAYAKSKIDTEVALQELADQNFKVTCLRFPTACGMSQRLRLDLVLNDFVASAIATGKIEILSDGTPWRPLIDTQDMARAVDWAISRDAGNRQFLAINAGSEGSNYQIKELAEIVREEIPGLEVSINEDAAPDKRSYRVDFGLYRELAPDHQPQISLRESVRQLRDGLEEMKFSDGGFRDSQSIRLQVLARHMESGRIDDRLRIQ